MKSRNNVKIGLLVAVVILVETTMIATVLCDQTWRKVDGITVTDKYETPANKKTIFEYKGKKYQSIDKEQYAKAKKGQKVTGHMVTYHLPFGINISKLHDANGSLTSDRTHWVHRFH